MQSTSSTLWGLTQNQTSVNCQHNDKLLLHTSACQYLSQNLTAPAWSNVFREEIEVLQKLGEVDIQFKLQYISFQFRSSYGFSYSK